MSTQFDDLIGQDNTLGNDGDQPGFASPISSSEIEELLYSDEWPAEQRIERLKQMRTELAGLEPADFGDDDPLALTRLVDDALAQLTGDEENGIEPGGIDADPAAHRETLSPDSDELADLRALDEAADDEAPLDPEEWREGDGFDPEQGVR
jgi:hypothetical protein